MLETKQNISKIPQNIVCVCVCERERERERERESYVRVCEGRGVCVSMYACVCVPTSIQHAFFGLGSVFPKCPHTETDTSISREQHPTHRLSVYPKLQK